MRTRLQTKTSAGQTGASRPLLLALVCFLLGVGASALLFSKRNAANPSQPQAAPLPASTQTLLGRQTSPVEIRFYSVLDPEGTSEATRAYADRLASLLTQWQEQSGGKLKVVRFDNSSPTNADAAQADGIKPLSGANGKDSFFGLCAIINGHKQSLAELSPEWEAAFGSDLSRLITQADAANAATIPKETPLDQAVFDEVKKVIPDPSAVSLDDGSLLLRSAALKEVAQAAADMQSQIADAEKKVTDAENSGNPADKEAAVKALLQLKSDQAEKIKAISLKAKNQVDAFAQLKKSAK
jgi:hypothetical protein